MAWEDISYVLRSKTRKSVLAKLERAKTPTILAKELHTSIPNISRALRELQSRSLIESLTPDARVGKIFQATQKGREVLQKAKEIEGQ